MRGLLKPGFGVLVAAALVFFGIGAGGYFFLTSKAHRTAVVHHASEEFGEALERAGIMTQPDASK
jgi:hypothetical protein